MKILWFTNTPSCYTPIGEPNGNPYNGGGWISSAEKAIREISDIELAVSFMLDGQPKKQTKNGVTYYPIPKAKRNLALRITRTLGRFVEGKRHHRLEESSWNYYLEYFQELINDFQPDIIHIWGSEKLFGLVAKVTQTPVILHIQGILNPYLNAYSPPFVSLRDHIFTSYNPISILKNWLNLKDWEDGCYRERIIFKNIDAVLGRTEWDERVAYILNGKAKYFHVDEILRDDFYTDEERSIPEELTIVSTISQPLYKGFDLILKTANILKNHLDMDFKWKCYGNIEPSVIEHNIGIKHNDVDIILAGAVTSQELHQTELGATLYFHPSYIDNSPNSLCEAQMLGLPVISTNVGGIPSLIEDGKDGFLIPSNDPYQAAFHILTLWKNKNLNITMGKEAQRKARKRHDPQEVVRQILNAYNEVLNSRK